MIYDVFSLWSAYGEIFSGKPVWFIILFAAIHIISLFLCIRFEKKGMLGKRHKGFSASLHYMLWWLVILVVPVFGALCYVMGAIIPFLIWKKEHPEDERFSYNCSLRVGQLWLMVAFGVLGKILEFILSWTGLISVELHLEFIVAFVFFIIIVSCDMITDFLNKRVYISLKSADNRPLVNKGKLLGKKLQIIDDLRYGEEYSKRIKTEMKAVRIVADVFFDQHPLVTKKAKSFVHKDKVDADGYVFLYSIPEYGKKNMPDVVETKCMMFRGLTQLTIIEDYDDKYIQRTIYVVMPKIRYMLMRFGILLMVLIILFTPAFIDQHLETIKFFANLV